MGPRLNYDTNTMSYLSAIRMESSCLFISTPTHLT